MDCGPTCLRMLCTYFGKSFSIQKLRELCNIGKDGVSLFGISEAAEKIGFRTTGVRFSLEQVKAAELPCILHWRHNHFVILYKIKNKKFFIANPGNGLIEFDEETFKKKWLNSAQTNSGVALLISPGPDFFKNEDEKIDKTSWRPVLHYFYRYKALLIQLVLGLAIGTILSLITPFLTQAIVDVGIDTKNMDFVYLILIAQLMLFIGSTTVSFIRSWILLHISTRINVSILTDFLIKIMKLPVSFFKSKTTGDIMQRMNDQRTIESFLTGTTLSTLFSLINLVVFTTVLLLYSYSIFWVSIISTLLYVAWIYVFLKRRRELNYKQFDNASSNQTIIVELVNGMQEIKLSGSERQKRWEWELIQAKLFKFKTKSLTLNQYQQGGAMFISQAKNILITFLSVKSVVHGDMTLGGMMAIQYIVGQIGNPVEQILAFIQSYQDAKISLERLNEIHHLEDEDVSIPYSTHVLPENKTLELKNLSFTYPGAGNEPALDNINLIIPEGKVTAIVGMSGSGKTTVLNLLLRFFEPSTGELKVGGTALKNISFNVWRKNCGTVMQDGFVFSDTIANNITIGDDHPDLSRLQNAIKMANLEDYIDTLPFGIQTKIGSSGNGLSQGQKQRLLIARAIYKNPNYLFFDEATNALDSNNEQIIMNNLQQLFQRRTVVIVAHRLSTVINADNIVVMKKGRIIEQGNHAELIANKNEYFGLIKNQIGLNA